MKQEFKEGDIVTFQSYKENMPLEREVLRVTEYNAYGLRDGNIYYHLGHKNFHGQAIITNQTTGKSIKQSKLFDLG